MKKSTGLENRYVAFIDILAFREIVASMAHNRTKFEFIRDVLKTIQKQERRISGERRKLLRAAQGPRAGTSFLLPSRPEMTAFSDCYVISDRSESGWQVLVTVQALAVWMLYKGILLRGGIVRGKAYHDGRVLFGPAVIAAHELEQTAKYPRVLVEDHIVRSERWLRAKDQFFLRDCDGAWFVNPFIRGVSYLSALLPELRPEHPESDFLSCVRGNIARCLSENMRSPKHSWDHVAKLRWLAARFNDAIASKPMPGIEPIDLDPPRGSWCH